MGPSRERQWCYSTMKEAGHMLYRTRKDDRKAHYTRRRLRRAVIARKLQYLTTYACAEVSQ